MALHERLLRIRPQLLAYARAICDEAHEADDLVQEALVRALSSEGAPASAAELRFWMFRIIRNLHVDNRRKSQVRAEYSAGQERLLNEDPATGGDPLAGILIRQVLESLSSDHREVVFLVDIMGMRYAEAARVLDVAEGTVMSRLSRARRAMIERMDTSNVTPITKARRRNR
jgi:RNA polymerase sigma-70 factor (ECF subfamily)